MLEASLCWKRLGGAAATLRHVVPRCGRAPDTPRLTPDARDARLRCDVNAIALVHIV